MKILNETEAIGLKIVAIHDNWQLDGDIYIEFEENEYLKFTPQYGGDDSYDVVISDDREIDNRQKAVLGLMSWDDCHKIEKQKQEQDERRQLDRLKSKYEK